MNRIVLIAILTFLTACAAPTTTASLPDDNEKLEPAARGPSVPRLGPRGRW